MEVKVTQDHAALKRDLLRAKILNSRKSIEDEKRISAAEKKLESKEVDEMCSIARMQEDSEKRQRANTEKKRWINQPMDSTLTFTNHLIPSTFVL